MHGDRVFGDAFCLVKVLQVFNSARGIINVFHFVNVDTVAAQWLSQYQRNNGQAMRDLVNFILRCTGTDTPRLILVSYAIDCV
jgi:hypothetical protein